MTATQTQPEEGRAPEQGHPARWRTRLRQAVAWCVLAVSALLGFFIASVAYSLSSEYSDPWDPDWTIARDTLESASPFLIIMGLLALVAALLGRSRTLSVVAAVAVTAALVGVPWASVLGAHAKADRSSSPAATPRLPHCASGFTTGPAARVARQAQAAFAELRHPAGFTGGGWSGDTGCTDRLASTRGVDPLTAYLPELAEHHWRITINDVTTLEAIRGDQAFLMDQDDAGDFWVWIGPRSAIPAQAGKALSPVTALRIRNVRVSYGDWLRVEVGHAGPLRPAQVYSFWIDTRPGDPGPEYHAEFVASAGRPALEQVSGFRDRSGTSTACRQWAGGAALGQRGPVTFGVAASCLGDPPMVRVSVRFESAGAPTTWGPGPRRFTPWVPRT